MTPSELLLALLYLAGVAASCLLVYYCVDALLLLESCGAS